MIPALVTISIFGLGHVGLVTAACFAKRGYEVLGIDVNENRLEQVRTGAMPFFEPGLDDYVRDAVRRGSFTVTNDSSLNAQSDITFITVSTPNRADNCIDLTYVENTATAIGKSLRRSYSNQLIVVKSTVVPGTAQKLVPIIENASGKAVGKDFLLCSNPEFLREGRAIQDTEYPDRLVIGSDDQNAICRLEGFYEEFLGNGKRMPPVIRTTHANAELIKYANNAFLATKISFINCIANVAQQIAHADVRTVAAGIGLDERIGPGFLNAGLGWGGSCFPKDMDALEAFAKRLGYDPEIIQAAVKTNEAQWRIAIDLAKEVLGTLKQKQVALLGLAFKPETDDISGAVSIAIIKELLPEGAKVIAYDPAAMKNVETIFGNKIEYARTSFECITQADVCIIVTEWEEFRDLTPSIFKERMRYPLIIDGRRIYEPDRFCSAGIKFLAIGLGPQE